MVRVAWRSLIIYTDSGMPMPVLDKTSKQRTIIGNLYLY